MRLSDLYENLYRKSEQSLNRFLFLCENDFERLCLQCCL
nr:MAG TPA: hypothetical protein [Caudoviricetes sp.]